MSEADIVERLRVWHETEVGNHDCIGDNEGQWCCVIKFLAHIEGKTPREWEDTHPYAKVWAR